MDPTATGAHYPLSQAYTALGDAAKAGEHLRLRRNRDIVPADPLMDEVNELLESPQTLRDAGHPRARSAGLANRGGVFPQRARADARQPVAALSTGDDDEPDG